MVELFCILFEHFKHLPVKFIFFHWKMILKKFVNELKLFQISNGDFIFFCLKLIIVLRTWAGCPNLGHASLYTNARKNLNDTSNIYINKI